MKGGFAVKITSSYAVEIKKQKMFDNTIKIYREAVSFLIGCFNKEWDSIQKVEGAKSRKSFAEKLIHTTKYSTAKYDFDAKFYKSCAIDTYTARRARHLWSISGCLYYEDDCSSNA